MNGILKLIPGSTRVLFVFVSAVSFVFSAQTQSPELFAAKVVGDALKQDGVVAEMKTIPRTPQEIRRVVSRNLDPRLLSQVRSISGIDFEYVFPGSNPTTQLGVIKLTYRNISMATRMAKILESRQNHFRNSKILIHFSSVRLGKLLVVAYSENSGDDRVVGALNSLPASFEKASESGTIFGR